MSWTNTPRPKPLTCRHGRGQPCWPLPRSDCQNFNREGCTDALTYVNLSLMSDTQYKQLSQEQVDKIREAINKLVTLPCPRCNNQTQFIADGYYPFAVSNDPKIFPVFGGTGTPCVGIVCDKCGFISFHALGVIGLLSPDPIPPSKEEQK